jgi:hypothetical protein
MQARVRGPWQCRTYGTVVAMTGSFLVARLHVDLQRVASAVCLAL